MAPATKRKVFPDLAATNDMEPGFLGGSTSEWATLLVLVTAPGLIATLLWSPILLAGRLRTLFGSLPITGSTWGNYVVTGLALSVPWVVGFGWAFGTIGARTEAVRTGEPLVDVAVQLSGLYVVTLPVAAGAGLPYIGVDWDPAGYGVSTWLLLVAASAWYATIYAAPAVLSGLLMSI